jgi:hypothetical protein
VYDSLDKDGNPNIKHSVNYEYKRYYVSTSDITENGGQIILHNYSETLMEDTNGHGVIPDPTITVGNPNDISGILSGVEIKENNNTNLSSVSIGYNSESDNYEITATVLVGIEVVSLYGSVENAPSYNTPVPCSGEKIIYSPLSLTITFYGETIGINLEDGNITYGEGKKPQTLSGNEILQDSGKVFGKTLTEHLAENVLNQYSEGKETATLLCSISKYFSDSGEIAINPYKKSVNIIDKYKVLNSTFETENNDLIARCEKNYSLINIHCYLATNVDRSNLISDSSLSQSTPSKSFAEQFYGFDKYSYFVLEIDFEYQDEVSKFFQVYDISALENDIKYYLSFQARLENDGKAVRISSLHLSDEYNAEYNPNKMTFDIGDVVVPMVFGADRKDRPMSLRKDGTAKTFSVVGVKYIYDGAPWQELTLQERKGE